MNFASLHRRGHARGAPSAGGGGTVIVTLLQSPSFLLRASAGRPCDAGLPPPSALPRNVGCGHGAIASVVHCVAALFVLIGSAAPNNRAMPDTAYRTLMGRVGRVGLAAVRSDVGTSDLVAARLHFVRVGVNRIVPLVRCRHWRPGRSTRTAGDGGRPSHHRHHRRPDDS